jgi:hypothetical protein
MNETNVFQIENSDIITFHSYFDLDGFKNLYAWIQDRIDQRPAFCSEYMARLLNCTFFTYSSFFHFKNNK